MLHNSSSILHSHYTDILNKSASNFIANKTLLLHILQLTMSY